MGLLGGCAGFGTTPDARLFNETGSGIALRLRLRQGAETVADERFDLPDGAERGTQLPVQADRRYTLLATTETGLSAEHDWQVEGENHGLDVIVGNDGIECYEYWME